MTQLSSPFGFATKRACTPLQERGTTAYAAILIRPLIAFLMVGTATHFTMALAQERLTCRPIATTPNQLPEVCIPESYREELYTFANSADIYQSEGVRWLDRIELWNDLAENQLIYGQGLSILRVNAFLRGKDIKDFISKIQPRLRLVYASSETLSKLKEIKKGPRLARLNVRVPLTQFLDQPFLFQPPNHSPLTKIDKIDNEFLAVDGLSSAAINPDSDLITVSTPSINSIENSEDVRNPSEHDSSAVSKYSITKQRSNISLAQCRSDIGMLIGQKESTESKLKQLRNSLEVLKKQTQVQNQYFLPKNLSPSQLANKIDISDCDLCQNALDFCSLKSNAAQSQHRLGNCYTVRKNESCYQRLPIYMKGPVDVCFGLAPEPYVEKISLEEQAQQAQLSSIENALRKKDDVCSSYTHEKLAQERHEEDVTAEGDTPKALASSQKSTPLNAPKTAPSFDKNTSDRQQNGRFTEEDDDEEKAHDL